LYREGGLNTSGAKEPKLPLLIGLYLGRGFLPAEDTAWVGPSPLAGVSVCDGHQELLLRARGRTIRRLTVLGGV